MLSDKIFETMEKEQEGYEWITVGLLWQLMGNMLKVQSESTPPYPQSRQQITKLKAVLSYIRDNYASQITLEELSARKNTCCIPEFLQN